MFLILIPAVLATVAIVSCLNTPKVKEPSELDIAIAKARIDVSEWQFMLDSAQDWSDDPDSAYWHEHTGLTAKYISSLALAKSELADLINSK